MIVSGSSGPQRVLTGSTNFSVTGMYVNSNHVLVFNDEDIAGMYSQVFNEAWATNAKAGVFQKSVLAAQEFTFATRGTPTAEITFAPHQKEFAASLMTKVTDRILQEGKRGKITGSVLFAIMDLGSGDGPVRPALNALHADQSIFSYGISDTTDGIKLYAPKTKTGVLVTGKPVNTILPPPFNQVPGVGIGHQIHHKFVVCGFNTPDAVVYCGSSNLATGGEESNGDNLLALRGTDVATAFAIEALALVDHFSFLDRYAKAPNGKRIAPAAKVAAAVAAKWFLSTNDKWTIPYYDLNDLRSVDRRLFG
jgi:phosphatidylserine/phosphatidylglycerophosphate/cardiolipin synthase-like enzyme